MITGWDKDVPTEILLQQLEKCLEEKDSGRVDRLLQHISPTEFPLLQSKACILGCHGDYMSPQDSFLPDSKLKAYPLAPYVDEVDRGFASKHATLLAVLNVQREPSIQDLRFVQESLNRSSQGQLNDSDLRIAIAALEISARLRYNPNQLQIPDTTSTLRDLSDIVHGDRNVRGDISRFNFTHPRVSEYLIRRLGIEDSFERAIKMGIGFEDEDEDEYTQRESLTTVICDTLGRYPIETTFNEFLANADDAGATRISWTIDECQAGPHRSDSLLARDLEPFQAAALISYNNSIFSDKDFAGFKEIGQGGKGDDATTTGMFGRGALSMYHFTDVPMIISGGFYLVLDPQQERLPRNKHHTHKAGVKIPLKTARDIAVDQLTPFDGLYGYDKSKDFFNGTIFRFPLRPHGIKTVLKDSAQHIDCQTAQGLLKNYFKTARVSLLFLQNVKEIEFCMRGEGRLMWKVSASYPDDVEVFRRVTIKSTENGSYTKTDVWQVGTTDIEQSPAGILKVGKGSSKITDCGIAACLEQGAWIPDSSDEKVPPMDSQNIATAWSDQKVFCRLPTSSLSQLPVSFHASFVITGDRKTIAFEDHSDVATWNNWLLAECLPKIYLDLLRDLSPKLGDETFRFWPSKPSTASMKTLSNTVALGFWAKVMDKDHVQYPLYPALESTARAAIQGANDLRKANPRKTRKLHKVVALGNAHFDFLPEATSDRLGPLFATLGLDRVRPPRSLWDAMENASPNLQLTELDSICLAGLFRKETNCKHLEDFRTHLSTEQDRAEAMAMLLEILVPIVDEEDFTPLYMLDGCRVLPKSSLDASLGLLRLNPPADSEWHLVASTEEQKLFNFACDTMVNTKLFPQAITEMGGAQISRRSRDPIKVLSKAPFNIRKLDTSDLGTLLAHPNSLSALEQSSDERDKWTKKLWAYLNREFRFSNSLYKVVDAKPVSVEDFLSKAKLWDTAIYRFTRDGQWQYTTPRQFNTDPCIVDPKDEQQRNFCAMIPGLKCLDPSCLPYSLSEHERDMDQSSSFRRFLDALLKLGRVTLPTEARKTLQGLLITFLRNFEKSEDVPEKAALLSLPVWPRIKRSEHSHLPEHLAAKDAWFFEHKEMIMPWVKDLKSFVDPAVVETEKSSLTKLGLKLTTVETFWQHIKKDLLSTMMGEISLQHHYQLVHCLAKYGIKPLANIAPNGSGDLGRINDLYDHDDQIFQSAFREERSARFLHPDFRNLRPFWVSNGLRARNAAQVMSSDDFLQCALALDRRYKPAILNQVFDQDALIVSTYICYDQPAFHSWPNSTWAQISKLRLFLVRQNVSNQRSYRQDRMRQIAQEHTHCALEHAGRPGDIRVLWSQVKWLDLEDNRVVSVLGKIPGGGSPLTATVYKQLQFLISKRSEVTQGDLQEYLKDIQACYSHLQDNANLTRTLPGIREEPIWFNFDTTQIDTIRKDIVHASLTSAKFLCLNTPCKEAINHFHTLNPLTQG